MWLIYGIGAIVLLFGAVVLRGAPYVPSHKKYARRALSELYPLSHKDTLVDIGSGDGVVLRIAAERGAKAVGYEINPILVLISKLLSRGNPRVKVRLADFWLVELPPETTLVYAFSVTRDTDKIAAKLQQTADRIKRPIRLMTYGPTVTSRQPDVVLQAHSLYIFKPRRSVRPLQSGKAQV